MSFNALNPTLFSAHSSCRPCCPAVACGCDFLAPVYGGPDVWSTADSFSDLATAETVISDQIYQCCIASIVPNPGELTPWSLSATVGTSITASLTKGGTNMSDSAIAVFMISLKSGDSISVSWAYSASATAVVPPVATNARVTINPACPNTGSGFDDSSTTEDYSTSGSGTYTVPQDGIYVVEFTGGFNAEDYDDITAVSASVTLADSDGIVVLPVIALWDDSGTTRQLEACPKLYLPPLTESTGDWYASCADAATVLADSQVVASCIFYLLTSGFTNTLTASGGSSPSASLDTNDPSVTSHLQGYFSVNAESGETISLDWTGPPRARLIIYDYTGTSIYDSGSGGSTSSPITSSALPYTGRYIVLIDVFQTIFDPPTVHQVATGTLSSSGTMSTNEIQALYDVGLTCSGRLNCGDSCP